MSIDRETLAAAGELLLGREWKRPLARLLGPHHPSGARETLDPRLPFRWATAPDPTRPRDQSRPIPDWVGPVLGRLLQERADVLAADAERARALAARLKGE